MIRIILIIILFFIILVGCARDTRLVSDILTLEEKEKPTNRLVEVAKDASAIFQKEVMSYERQEQIVNIDHILKKYIYVGMPSIKAIHFLKASGFRLYEMKDNKVDQIISLTHKSFNSSLYITYQEYDAYMNRGCTDIICIASDVKKYGLSDTIFKWQAPKYEIIIQFEVVDDKISNFSGLWREPSEMLPGG